MPIGAFMYLGILSSVAAFVGGGVFTHILTVSGQRTQWVLDSKKQECRELLKALSVTHIALMHWYADIEMTAIGPNPKILPSAVSYNDANTELGRTFGSLLFTAKEVRDREIQKRWNTIQDDFRKNNDREKLQSEFSRLSDTIVGIASTDLSWCGVVLGGMKR
ncbi:hypothetical protein [Granulicella sp. dw_53]|uniref:hypothetical protein n=1 Tax=Granulicella sp. dw_53 TaxID=2719792 RepID=UPI001BD4A3CE|nr:hypothetical protein [Granulicella sp. dw_53]